MSRAVPGTGAAVAPAPLRPGERRDAARVLADAFVDDPGWTATGPRGRERRRRYIHRICLGEILLCGRAGGTALATRDAGRVTGVVVWYPPSALPAPWWLTAGGAPGALLAGPSSVRRSLAGTRRIEEGHPAEEHLYVSLLAVDPAHQRGGRGRGLLGAALAAADALGVPAYLDTANPANLPYYRSFGFAETGRAPMPGGATLWYLLRAT